MAISASTLFHFTQNKETLKGILQGNFTPRYSLEDLSSILRSGPVYSVHIPMVCFCDLLLSQISGHMGFYGEYGIGLRKMEWGIKKGISPVLYVSNTSRTAKLMRRVVKQVAASKVDEVATTLIHLLDFCKYIKAYEGETLNRSTREWENRTFYHEREWRYSPFDFPAMIENKANDTAIKVANERLAKKRKLSFNPADVKYIIVPGEHEIPEFVDHIEHSTHLENVHKKLLVSKIISAQQIRDDM